MGYTYKHVVIVGLDGMGNFNQHTETPNFDRIFADGAQSLYSESLYPTISAQNWGAMLIGTYPDVHGLTNSIVSRDLYTNKELPSIFTTVRKAMPDATLASICHWDPINHGIIEHDVGVYMESASSGEDATNKTVKCILEQKPTLLFIHIDDPDGAGHHFGYGTEGHLECIRNTDKLVDRIHQACCDAGIIDETLFIVITDHGGFVKGHGGYSDGEKYIYFALKGKTVNKVDEFFGETKDINAIVRHAFGIEIPAYDPNGYSSQIPVGVFCDYDKEYQKVTAARFDVENRPTPAIDGENGLYSYFDKDEIKLAMFFDNNGEDATGKNRFREERHVKFYSSGVNGSNAEFGVTGFYVSDDLKFGKDSFTVAEWLKVDDAPNWECFIASTKTMTASGAGFTLGFTSGGTFLGIETEDPSTYNDPYTSFFREVSGGWIHSIYSFNKKDLTIDVYHNFKFKQTIKLPDIFDISLDCLPFTVGEEASHHENSTRDALFNMDDLFIFNKAFDAADVAKLKEYYGL